MRIKILIIVLFSISELNAQSIDNWIEQNETLPIEKLYIQTDKEFYYAGERIWFKTYLLDSKSDQLIPGAENIYINILNEDGEPVLKSAVISANGLASGNLYIPEELKAGVYLLEAFTDYLLNFTPNSFFYKPLNISRITPSVRLSVNEDRFSRTQQMVGDVSFLPEGGMLLANTSNLVAFKAINKYGYGVEATGSVRDENGNLVTEFKTDYKGMGLFFLTPDPTKSYTARINGFPSFKYNFNSLIATEGIKLQVVNHTVSDLIINVASNTNKYIGKKFYLVNMNQGQVIFYQAFKNERINHVLKFNSENLIGGINRLVLLNSNLKPISECFVFSDNYEINNLHVSSDSATYTNRSAVNLKIEDEKQLPEGEFSNLSISVLNENAISPYGQSQNILSHLLIGSELNDFVEQSVDFFTNNNLSSASKLRLLMLTNGWSTYLWNSVPDLTDSIKYEPKVGIDIKGTAVNSIKLNPLENGEITLIIEKDGEMAFLKQNTNKIGEFTFPGLLFNDTAKVYIQAKNKRGKMNTKLTLSTVFPTTSTSKSHLKGLSSFYQTPYILQKQTYERELAMKKFDPYYKTRNIGQVDVVEKKPKKNNHFKIYDQPDQVVEIPKNEPSYSNVLEYLTGKVTGLDISQDDIYIRGISAMGDNSTPLFLIDGVPIMKDINIVIPENGIQDTDNTNITPNNDPTYNSVVTKVKSIPLKDIEKVDILKSAQNLALFGTEGANGVIAIYTRKGEDADPNPYIKGLIEKNIQGYASNRKFYSPKYTPENKKNPKPDLRTTLFWEPEITTKDGKVHLNFHTSDQTGSYVVFVEGITNNGKICLGTANFEVVKEKGDNFGQQIE